MILVIDNFDSFTYNLVQFAGAINPNIKIIKNNECSLDDLKRIDISHIIISPGPGHPDQTGICSSIIKEYMMKIPILGVCLGHQLIAQIFGAEIINAQNVVHGKTSLIKVVHESAIFKDVPRQFEATRYHSLVVKKNKFKDILITSCTDNEEIMSIQHKNYNIYGLQFHPESVKTEYGMKMIENFLKLV